MIVPSLPVVKFKNNGLYTVDKQDIINILSLKCLCHNYLMKALKEFTPGFPDR